MNNQLGRYVRFSDDKYVLAMDIAPNENLPKGRCLLIKDGNPFWHDMHAALLVVEPVRQKSRYIEVSQHNFNDWVVIRGRPVCQVIHKAPVGFDQAQEWAHSIGGITFSDVERCGWGSACYYLNDNGVYEFVKGNWDSSG